MEFSVSTFFGVTAGNPLMTNQPLISVARQPTLIEYLQHLGSTACRLLAEGWLPGRCGVFIAMAPLVAGPRIGLRDTQMTSCMFGGFDVLLTAKSFQADRRLFIRKTGVEHDKYSNALSR